MPELEPSLSSLLPLSDDPPLADSDPLPSASGPEVGVAEAEAEVEELPVEPGELVVELVVSSCSASGPSSSTGGSLKHPNAKEQATIPRRRIAPDRSAMGPCDQFS